MEKWTGELGPAPVWLDPSRELKASDEPPKLAKAAFIIMVLTTLVSLGCSFDQALGVAANVMNETAWGRAYRAWNLGGWKIYKDAAREKDGSPRFWWRALGNKSSGDAQTVFYRAFRSAAEFLAAWLKTFVPKVDPAGKPNGRYWKTGQQFWSGEEWFDDLVAAGYKGDVTRRNPLPSMREHASIIKTLMVYWAQAILKVSVDGKWGPKTTAALKAYQKVVGLPETGHLDEATIPKLFQTSPTAKMAVLAAPLLKVNPDAEDDDDGEMTPPPRTTTIVPPALTTSAPARTPTEPPPPPAPEVSIESEPVQLPPTPAATPTKSSKK